MKYSDRVALVREAVAMFQDTDTGLYSGRQVRYILFELLNGLTEDERAETLPAPTKAEDPNESK